MTTNNTDGAALLPVTPELLPCPFCGGEPELWTPTICLGDDDADVDYMQICCGCGVTGSRHRFRDHNRQSANFIAVKAHAIDTWNTRISHSLPGDVGTEKLRGLSERAAPAPWVVYSEPEVGLFASVFSGTVMETGFAPVNLDDPSNVEFIVEAVNFARAALSSPLPATQEDAERSGARESHRCETPLEISKRLTDAKTAILRNAVERRRETSTPQRQEYDGEAVRAFKLGDRVYKKSGSSWRGKVVGFYSTALTPVGYAVESDTESGSVQIYPEKALAALPSHQGAGE